MPSVTPEMVEKARLWLLEHGFKGNTVIMAEFAASAVQDAVRECTPFLQHNRTCQFWDSWLGREIPCTCGLAALREKYGVKP